LIRKLSLIVLAVLALAGCSTEPTVGRVVSEALTGDLRQYEAPSETTRTEIADLVRGALNGDKDLATPDQIELTQVRSNNRNVTVIREQNGRQGMGVYAVRAGSGSPARLVVEVPHPRADKNTEVLGPLLFEQLNADALLVAGTHRSVADVAHEPDTVFASVDEAIVGAGTVVVQLHGFDESRHSVDAQVVLSSTRAQPSPLVLRLASALEDADYATCVYDGESCRALAGTENVEAAHARSVAAEFVHLELAVSIRQNGEQREQLAAILASVLR